MAAHFKGRPILKKTSLHDEHVALGARMIEFHGWSMPLSYNSVIQEHHSTRNDCGIFDVSHMGQVFVRGKNAAAYLQYVTMNNIHKLTTGKAQYSALLYETGGFVDDIIVYMLEAEHYLVCINSANLDKDVTWLSRHNKNFQADIRNASNLWSQIAVQGPKTLEVLGRLDAKLSQKVRDLDFMAVTPYQWQGVECYVARTGYTGEFGVEIYLPNTIASSFWRASLEAGAKPIGLGARDTLRLEAGLLLYGNDMNETVNPIEAGISWALDLDTDDFIGRSALVDYKNHKSAPQRKLVCFKLNEKGIARPGMDVYANDKLVGKVTSASILPSLDCSGGFALVDAEASGMLQELEIDIRGKRKLAQIHKRPLYSSRTRLPS